MTEEHISIFSEPACE